MNNLLSCADLRMGKQQGFKDIKAAQVHSVGTACMRAFAVNVHENVPEFDEARSMID